MPLFANEYIVPTDFPTISAAIAAANDFDTIRVLPGTYNETVIINKSIQLLGAQAGVDARERTGVPESIITGSSIVALVQLTADHVVIDGFTIQGNLAGTGVYSVPTASGYWIFNNIIQNNVFGLYLNASGETESQVKQNFFNSNTNPGASSGNGIYSDQGASDILIDSNKFTGHTNASIVFAVNLAIPTTDIIISRNQMINDSSIALFKTNNVKITENAFLNTTGSSIFLGGGTNHTEIERNILRNGSSNGISVNNLFPGPPENLSANTNVRAKDNSISSNATAGLRIATGTYDPTSPSRFLDATNNYWGSPTGPTGIPGGTGDAVIDPDNVAYVVPFLSSDPLPIPPGTSVIQPIVRQASTPTTTYVAGTKVAAVTAAINNAGTLAQAIGNLPGRWPEIHDYEAPNNASLLGEPAIVWEDSTAAPGELRYFSQAFQDLSNFPTSQVVFSTVFTDNAHRLFIEEYDAGGALVQSITPPGGLNDGTMSAAAGTTTDTTPPLNWQKLRQYSKVFTPSQSGNFIVITVEALNYNSLGPNNPAGVSFVADFYKNNF
jgi:Right handed beta helix region